jgi:NitT/TauT family transport system permease protein
MMMSTLWQRSERVRSVVLVLVASIALWEAAVRLLEVRKFILPAPSAIVVDLWREPAYFARQTAYTLGTTALGFALAVALGLALAVAIVHSRFLDRTLYTFLVVLNSIPKVALAPLFVIWLGTGIEPKVAIAVMIAIFSIVIDGVLGLRSVDPEALNLARVSRARPWAVLVKIRLPNALPYIFSGMKVAISFALVGAIVGEFVAGEVGLGSVILQAQSTFDTTRAFAAILLLGVMGTVLFFLVELAERLMLPWHVSQRAEATGHHV